MQKIHIHEDHEGMRNLHPAQAISHISNDLAASEEHSAKHRAPDGAGWTELRVIQEPDFTFADLGIPVASLAPSLENVLPRIKKFELGFGENNPFHYLDHDAFCYGLGPHLFIKVEVDNDLVESIWFEARPINEDELLVLRLAIEAIDRVQSLSIVDYWLHMGGTAADRDFMDQYCNAIAHASYEQLHVQKMAMAPKTAWSRISIFQRLFGRQ
jgi:hypothetical protein